MGQKSENLLAHARLAASKPLVKKEIRQLINMRETGGRCLRFLSGRPQRLKGEQAKHSKQRGAVSTRPRRRLAPHSVLGGEITARCSPLDVS